MKLKESSLQIELKNGFIIQGSVILIDNLMNIFLSGVRIVSSSKKFTTCDNISIRGSQIRYIIFQDTMNLDSLLVSLDKQDKKNKRESRIKNITKNSLKGKIKK